MKVIYGLSRTHKYPKPVTAIGVFDGVHRGHRIILKAAVMRARRIKGTSMVLTFWPHPQKEALLYSLPHRLKLIEEAGIDVCVVIRFDSRTAGLSAEEFIKKLTAALPVHSLYVGKNFKFGAGARGDRRLLKRLSGLYGFQLKIFAMAHSGSRPVSSTQIRRLIRSARLSAAGRLLGRPVSVLGTVKKGKLLGRKLGFPTANIDPHHEVVPPSGVYAVKAILQGKAFNGVCNIGVKPTFNASSGPRHIEVYIYGFNRNIYGRDLQINFLKKIRREKRFSSWRLLADQINRDIIRAQKIFSRS